MKKVTLFLIIIAFIEVNCHSQGEKKDSVSFEILKQNVDWIIEIPFGVGVTSSAACFPSIDGVPRDASTYFGLTAKKYLKNNIRIDMGYKADFVGTDNFESMQYYTGLHLRANYPLLSRKHKWGTIMFLNSTKYFFIETPKYKALNVSGGYNRYLLENKLALGLNYSSTSYVQVRLKNSKRTKTSFNYFEFGGEALFRFAYSDFVQGYYEFIENNGRLGWNAYILYNYSPFIGKLEIGGHNGPILKFTLGVIFGG